MQFIRTYKVFCLLGDLAILRWKKLRTYRCVKNIQKYLFQLLIPSNSFEEVGKPSTL